MKGDEEDGPEENEAHGRADGDEGAELVAARTHVGRHAGGIDAVDAEEATKGKERGRGEEKGSALHGGARPGGSRRRGGQTHAVPSAMVAPWKVLFLRAMAPS